MNDTYHDDFGMTPAQLHAGLDKLWAAIGTTGPHHKDIFTLAAEAIEANCVVLDHRHEPDELMLRALFSKADAEKVAAHARKETGCRIETAIEVVSLGRRSA